MKKNPDISKEKLTELYYQHESVHKVGKIIGRHGDTVWRWLKHYNIPPPPKKCNECSILLTIENTYPSDWESGSRLCKTCKHQQYKLNYKEENQKIYSLTSNLKIKNEIIIEYGEKCACCGEDSWQFLSIDHIDGRGSEHRKSINQEGRGGNGFYYWLKKNKFPKDNFRLLCNNCNCSYGHNGFCPHLYIKKSETCIICDKSLLNNIYDIHKNYDISICKNCIINISPKRKTAKNEIIDNVDLLTRRVRNKEYTISLKNNIINGYGSICECCGEKNPLFLTIEHKNNDGAKERNSLGFTQGKFYRSLITNKFPTDNYGLLCYNCNLCKGSYGKCYHKLCLENNKFDISIDEYKSIILETWNKL